MANNERDIEFLREAYLAAAEISRDPDTQSGVVIVRNDLILLRAGNSQPRRVVLNEERKQKPVKYFFITHAERKAVYRAAREGIPLEGATMYSPWFPCSECMQAIIDSGISRLVGHKDLDELCARFAESMENGNIWTGSQKYAFEMLKDSGIRYHSIEGKIGGAKILFKNRVFEP